MVTFKLLFMIFQSQGKLLAPYPFAWPCLRLCFIFYVVVMFFYFLVYRLKIPHHMLPETEHPSILSVLQCDNHTVINVLVDLVID